MTVWQRYAVFGAMLLASSGLARPPLPQIALQPVVTGLTRPVALAVAPNRPDWLFLVEQGGRIRIVEGEELRPTPFLDLSERVSCCGERGLLGLAFHPRYGENGFFFVNYTDTAGDTVVARYRVLADPARADPASATVLLTIPQPFGNHNGGQLAFGPDGYLYIGTGDGGSGGDPLNNGQRLDTLLGKLLRIDVNAPPYGIPPDNPFRRVPGARPEIWAYGLRNPWRFSFDRATGDLYIADVGQNRWEEVNLQPAGSPGGQNYGWRIMEGRHCFTPPEGCAQEGLTLPILEYDHTQGCSITGGYVYRGRAVSGLEGVYLYGDFCSGRIWGAWNEDGRWHNALLLETGLAISAFGEDATGEVYVLDYASGSVYRIVPGGP